MDTMPRKLVWGVALFLLVVAGIGAFQGWRRSGADADLDESSVPGLVAPAANNAKTASPLSEPAGLTEAQVREIARQEARAVLHPASATPAAPAEAPEPAAPSNATAPAPLPRVLRPATPQLAAPAPAPASPLADGGQPQLF